jgi:hypothetical protein
MVKTISRIHGCIVLSGAAVAACGSDGISAQSGAGGAKGSTSAGSGGSVSTTAGTASSGTGGAEVTSGSGGTSGVASTTGTAGSSPTSGAGGSPISDAGMDSSGSGGGGIGGDGGVKWYFDGTSLDAWIQKPLMSWTIMDMAMYGLGNGRGFVFTKDKFTDYRVIFTLRQVAGNHKPTVLVYNQSPDIDAMGGIQFQPPQGGHWDYRAGHNDAGSMYFKTVNSGAGISTAMWARCEILVLSTGTARMACCQLPSGTGACKAMEILDFHDDPSHLSTTGPFAIQVHNGGIHDEYKDVSIESNPAIKDLITTK